MTSKFLREYRIVVVGAGGTGKTCITVQFVNSHFVDEYDPTLEDSYRKQVVIDDEVALADVLDTAGQEEYSAMREQYMRTGEGFILVYSITSRDSFEEMKTFHKQILQVKKEDSWPMILVGNKNDLSSERMVSAEEGEALAQSFGCSFLETSAKRRYNIDETFLGVIRAIRVKGGHYSGKDEKKGIFARNKTTAGEPADQKENPPTYCFSGCSVM